MNSDSGNIGIVVGTRPEAIKLAPLYLALSGAEGNKVDLLLTGQHMEIVDNVLANFGIHDSIKLELNRSDDSLSSLTIALHQSFKDIFASNSYDLVIVQGDTTSGMVAALEAFYHGIKVAHVEAGLRTDNKLHPFPEEINRRIISQLADFHFCPTNKNLKVLENESIQGEKFVVGNTVIDALKTISQKINNRDYETKFVDALSASKSVLVTTHRRENFGDGLKSIYQALIELAEKFPETSFICPVHPNPQVKGFIYGLSLPKNIMLSPPLSYQEIIFLYSKVDFVMTDSGGIQEEAPSFGLPVLVLRETTERTEVIESGNGILVGSDKNKIIAEASRLLYDEEYKDSFKNISNPYGDGTTSIQIAKIINSHFSN